MAAEYTIRQVNIESGIWRSFNIKLAEKGMKKKDFAENMLSYFHDKQKFIHHRKRKKFSYPHSVPKSEPHEIFQMKFSDKMLEILRECLEEAKNDFPDEAETLSERRVLKAMFDEYLDYLDKQ